MGYNLPQHLNTSKYFYTIRIFSEFKGVERRTVEQLDAIETIRCNFIHYIHWNSPVKFGIFFRNLVLGLGSEVLGFGTDIGLWGYGVQITNEPTMLIKLSEHNEWT
jgi:hypothetical protein